MKQHCSEEDEACGLSDRCVKEKQIVMNKKHLWIDGREVEADEYIVLRNPYSGE
jgi:hypothetical protein